jgi:Tfp pilus assembly protein PilF
MAVSVLQTYTIFAPEDFTAAVTLGMAYNETGKYDQAIVVLNRALDSNPRDAEAYNQRGFAYLSQEKGNLAEADYKLAVAYDPWNFEAHLGLARTYYLQGNPGDAYVQVETNAYPLAQTNEEKAEVFYWAATFLEQIDDQSSQQGARNYWRMLIALPADVMLPEWRQAAFEHLNITPTFTRTSTRTRTPSPTPTLNP